MTGQVLSWLWRSWQPYLRYAGLVTLNTGQGKLPCYSALSATSFGCSLCLACFRPPSSNCVHDGLGRTSDTRNALHLPVLGKITLMRTCITASWNECFSLQSAETHTLILVQGSNLIRSDLALQYRIAPADAEVLRGAALVPTWLFKEWNAMFLIEERVRTCSLPVLACLSAQKRYS